VSAPTPRVWGIHGGKTGDAFTLFTERGVVALGWHLVGDLTELPNDAGAFRERVATALPTMKAGAVPVGAGQLRRFIYELAVGDVVVFPARQDWTFRVGRITGPYTYVVDEVATYPHRRTVEWKKTIPRDALSQSARFELGSAMSFFRVKRHADEVLRHLSLAPQVPATEDEETEVTSARVEEATHEFVLDRLRRLYAGHALEGFVADLLTAMGYSAATTQMSGDHGVDVVAGKGALGLDPPILKVQVKSGRGPVGEPDLLKLAGGVEHTQGERGVVVALGGFSPPALRWASGRAWFQLIDPGELVEHVLAYYDELPAEHREKIPLRRVYAPETAEEESA
jgi:restriction system protein